jgi:aspartyl aminopeptidase
VRDARPLLRIPQLAIHLDRDVNEHGLKLDKQRHLTPVWGLGDGPGLAEHLAGLLDVAPGDVVAHDLAPYDLQPATLAGGADELIASARLDNLCSCHAGLAALAAQPDDSRHVAVLALFDHEEVGSTSARGAAGSFLAQLLERSVLARGGDRTDLLRALADSSCASADMAHATHPNDPERHEPGHHISLNAGPVLKVNANQRYATDAATAAGFAAACDAAGVPLQRFVGRNDMPCGSTIGPSTAAQLGVPTVDVGVAQLAMHSVRELCGAEDPHLLVRALRAFLSQS